MAGACEVLLSVDVSRILSSTLAHLTCMAGQRDPAAVLRLSLDAVIDALDVDAAVVVTRSGEHELVLLQRGLVGAECDLFPDAILMLPEDVVLRTEPADVPQTGRRMTTCVSGPFGRLLAHQEQLDDTVTRLYALARDGRDFTQQDAVLLSVLARQLSAALEHGRLLTNADRRTRRADALRACNQAMAATLESQAVLDQFCSALLALTPADRVSVLLLDEDAQSLRLGMCRGEASEAVTQGFRETFTTLPAGRAGPIGECLDGRRTLTGRIGRGPLAVFGDPRGQVADTAEALFQPMLADQEPVGVVILEQLHDSGPLRGEHLDTVAHLTDAAAVAMQHAELYERAERDRAQLAALHDVTMTISSSEDLASTLQRITDSAARLTGADRCRLGLQRDESTYRLAAVTGDTDVVGAVYTLDRTIGGWIIRTGRSTWLPDMDLGRSEPPEVLQIARRKQGSALGVPLRGRTGGILGFLSLHHHLAGHFRRDVSALAERFAAEAVLAVEASVELRSRRHLEERLRQQAQHDPLTGLANRTLFAERVTHALALHNRDPRRIGILFCDLDDFKHVNDTYGHTVGDVLLTQAGHRLIGTLRPGDTLARLGGDEFAVLVEDGGDAVEVARRMAETFNAPFSIDAHILDVHASIGIAVVEPSEPAPSCEALLAKADVAMYAAKRAGKNRQRVFRPGMRLADPEDSQLRGRLARALRAGEIRAVYQPIMYLSDGTLLGFEALARWDDLGTPVEPDVFVPLAEKAGLMPELTDFMLEVACRQLAEWSAQVGHDRLRVGVNISPRELVDTAFPVQVRAVMGRHGIQPGQLVLEVTERTLITAPELAQQVTNELFAAGVRLSLDDFGVGYSSLAQIHQIPLHSVKIDRLFTKQVAVDPRSTRMVRAIVRFAQELDLAVVAEGIETPEQLAVLRDLGCDFGQGYLLAPPHPAEQHADLVQAAAGGAPVIWPAASPYA